MKRKPVTVLDLGSTKVVCATFDFSEGEPRVLAFASDSCGGLRRGSITDPQAASGAIDAVVKKVQAALGQEVQELVVGIGGHQVYGSIGRGYLPIYPKNRTITSEDVLQVINHSRQGTPKERVQLQAIPGGFAIDGSNGIHAPIGRIGSKIEVSSYIVSADPGYLKNMERALGIAGKKASQMVLRPLASALAVTRADERERGVAAIDIGGGTSELAVFEHGALVAHGSVPLGGQSVTSDLSKLLKTSIEEAERLKLEHGCTNAATIAEDEAVEVLQLGQTHKRPLQRRVLCEIVESRMRELCDMLRQQLEDNGLLDGLPAGVIVTGGGSQLTGTLELLKGMLEGVEVQARGPHVEGQFADLVNNPAMSTAVGLALFAGQSYDDELSPAYGGDDWKERIRTLWSLVSGRS
jgi:cell division protein FtsA